MGDNPHMTSNEYVLHIINSHALPLQIDQTTKICIIDPLKMIIAEWAGDCLCETKLSGSRAKGTAIDLSADLYLFLYHQQLAIL